MTEHIFCIAGHVLHLSFHQLARVAMAGKEREDQRQHAAKHSRKTWKASGSHGKMLQMPQWTGRDGDKLLLDVPSCTTRTKSK